VPGDGVRERERVDRRAAPTRKQVEPDDLNPVPATLERLADRERAAGGAGADDEVVVDGEQDAKRLAVVWHQG